MRTKKAPSQAKRAKPRASQSKPQTNGTPRTPTLKPPKAPERSAAKSPAAQPAELSESDRRRLHEYLELAERPFLVHTVPASRKRKRSGAQPMQLQEDLFEQRLSVQYEVKPRDKWESLRRYKKFTVGSESIATGECILVKHDETEDPRMDIHSQWKAKVLEVRALDQEHVYIRLSWLNRPEDLPSGRKDYHGKNELIPTNQMDIIDAMAVNGALPVRHWDEQEDSDEQSMPAEDEFFWRQTFDFANTKSFSNLRRICVDDAPQNPDELIVQCSNGECRKWMHVRCIAKNALERASSSNPASSNQSQSQLTNPTPPVASQSPNQPPDSSPKKGKLKNPANNPNLTAVADATKGLTTAEVFVKGYPDRPNVEPAEEDEIVITTETGEQYSEEVRCLFCETEVE